MPRLGRERDPVPTVQDASYTTGASVLSGKESVRDVKLTASLHLY